MKLEQFLKEQQPLVPTMLQLTEKEIWIEPDPLRPNGFSLHVDTGDKVLDRLILDKTAGGVHLGINWLVLCRMFREGVKVFRFSTETLEAMENYELNLPTSEYHQPFPTLVIDFPEDYCTARQVPFTNVRGQSVDARPQFVIMHKVPDQPILCVLIVFEDDVGNIAYGIRLTTGATLEQCWEQNQTDRGFNPQEQAVANAGIRACLNANLLATHFGVSKGQPGNFQQQNALAGRLHQAQRRKQTDKVTEYKARLAAVPWVYTIDQEVAIYRKEASSHEGQPTGRHVHPHWRRGHWRNQPCGPGLQQTKRIPIPAVLVNGHRLLGNDTSHTTYVAKE